MRILHIDDEQAEYEIISYNLLKTDSTLDIKWVASGPEAVDILKQQPFDFILCDLQMPEMTGMELLCHLREMNDDTPLAFLTGQGNEKLAAEAFRNGADEYYTKDVGFAHYTRMLNSIRRIVKARGERRGRLEAIEATRQSERLYRTVFESAGDSMFIHAMDTKCIEVNSKACEMFGCSSEDIIGHYPSEFETPEFAEQIGERLEKIKEEEQIVFETECIRADGKHIIIEVNARIIDYLGQKAILSIAREITDRKQTERELLVKTKALETSVYGVAFADLEGRLTYVNTTLLELWGYDDFEEVRSHNMYDFWEHRFSEREIRGIFVTLKKTGYLSQTARARKKDGTLFHVRFTSELVRNEDGEPVCIMGTFANVSDQIQAEQELLLKNYVVESSNMAIAVADTNGVITYANRALLDMGGYSESPDEIINQSSRRFFSSPKAVIPMYRALTDHGSWEGELQARRRDGSVYPVLATANAVTDSDGKQICWTCTLQDLTLRKLQEKKQRENELRLLYLFNNAACGIVLADPKGQIIELNETFAKMLGYSREEILGLTIAELTYPDDRAESKEYFSKAIQNQIDGFRIEKRYICKDKHILWCDIAVKRLSNENSEVQGALGIILDISEQKMMREELKLSERKFRSLFEDSNVIMYIADGNTMEIIDVNSAAVSFYGYPREELLTMKLYEISTENREILQDKMRLIERNRSGQIETTHRLSDGSLRELNISVKPIDLPGRKSCHFAVATDVTERNNIERQLKRNTEILKEKTRSLEILNSELTSFSYSISHDLRAPLRYITGFSNLLQDHCTKWKDEQANHHLERIIASCKQMNDLIDGLLKLSRVSGGKLNFEDIDLSKISCEIIEVFHANEPGRDIKILITDGITAQGDLQLIRNVLTNLLANAWKFTKKTKKPYIEVGYISEKGEAPAIFIRDNGAGFSPPTHDNLFVPFRRLHTEREFEGTGIGLATVQRIIHRHGGRIWAEGKPGKGATFYFTIPGLVTPDL